MNLKAMISSVAPFVGSLVGGPFGAGAGKLVAKFLCGDENASEEQIQKALAEASPSQLVELRRIDAEYKTEMAKIGIDEKKLMQLDRENARNREIATGDLVPSILAYSLTLGFFGILFTLIFAPIPAGVSSVIDIMLGALGTAWISIITYYFGSSAGSSLKTKIMSEKS